MLTPNVVPRRGLILFCLRTLINHNTERARGRERAWAWGRRPAGRKTGGTRLSMRSRVDGLLQKTPASYINWRCKCDVLAPHQTENNKGHPARKTDRQADTHEDQPDALPTESNAKYATVFDVRHGTVNTKRTKQEAEVSIATKRKRNSDVV